jgi:hypothetical protein
MDKQQIEIVIKTDGTVEESVSGVSGPDCETLTDSFEKMLGVVTEREKKPDYYNQTQKQGGNVTTNV